MKNEMILFESENVLLSGDKVTISMGYRKGSEFNIKLADNDPRIPAMKEIAKTYAPLYQSWRDAQHLIED